MHLKNDVSMMYQNTVEKIILLLDECNIYELKNSEERTNERTNLVPVLLLTDDISIYASQLRLASYPG